MTFPDGNVGTLNTWFFSTHGLPTSQKPVQFSVVAGLHPAGHHPLHAGRGLGRDHGPPDDGRALRLHDPRAGPDRRERHGVVLIRVNAARPVVITNQGDQLNERRRRGVLLLGNLFADGGTPGYTWTLRAGALPPGLRLQASPGRITGTPTTRGAFSFTVRATDTRGAFAERTFSITVS